MSIWIKSVTQLAIFGLGESGYKARTEGQVPKRDGEGQSGSVFPSVYIHKMKSVGLMALASRGTVLDSCRLLMVSVAACICKKI